MEPDDELHSFPYNEIIEGLEHNYRITQNGDSYGIERDGVVIAEVSHKDQWQQISGNPLGEELKRSICEHIESHYD